MNEPTAKHGVWDELPWTARKHTQLSAAKTTVVSTSLVMTESEAISKNTEWQAEQTS